jgi:hypothetical protein
MTDKTDKELAKIGNAIREPYPCFNTTNSFKVDENTLIILKELLKNSGPLALSMPITPIKATNTISNESDTKLKKAK